MRALTPRQVTLTAACKTQTMTMHQSKSRRDDPTSPRYAMSGFHIEKGGGMSTAAIDAHHRTNPRQHDMAAGL